MKNRQYNSFEEIDQQLKIYSLKKEINIENIKLSISESKDKLYKSYLINNFNSLIQGLLVSFVAKKIFKYFRK